MNMDNINSLSFINEGISVNQNNNKETESNFGFIFNSAVRLLDSASRAEHEAQQIQMDYISGRTDDMLSVILAEQKAHTAVTFTAQVTSSIMDSYRQIMNLQV